MNLPDPQILLDQLAEALKAHLQARQISDPVLVGIHSGGVWVAAEIARRLGIAGPLGELDISFHRDDYSHHGLNPSVSPSQLPWDVDGAHVLLIDDVLYTGRTVRAAINELFDWGRPASVTLCVLVARDGRELPIAADVIGAQLHIGTGRQLKLRGPAPLRFELHEQPR